MNENDSECQLLSVIPHGENETTTYLTQLGQNYTVDSSS